jgi:cytochrome c-type biogenesis protein CcmH
MTSGSSGNGVSSKGRTSSEKFAGISRNRRVSLRIGDRVQAAAIWRALVDRAPPDAPWLDFVRRALARVGGEPAPAASGPSEEQVAASADLPPEQRTAMIRSMVERLADRLTRDGSDVEGWLRLVRSYMVLGERDKARVAAGNARRALAADPGKLQRLDDLVKGLGLEG